MATSAAYVDFDEAAAPSTPAAGKVRQYAKTDGKLYQKDDAGTETDLAAAGGASSTGQQNQLGSDQAVVQNVWKDGPSISLLAGTYFLFGTLTILSGTASGAIIGARLSDGTTHLASTERKAESAGTAPVVTLSVSGYVVVPSTTTWKLQGITSNASGATLKAACTTNASGNTASTLTALKIA